jgi:hypothetical protein
MFILKFFIILYYIENQSNAKIIKLENYLLFLFFGELGFCSTSCSLSNAFHAYDGYEGTLTGWLVPRVKAGESVRLIDRKRDETSIYYVTDVEVEFGQNGAKRKVSLGRRLG